MFVGLLDRPDMRGDMRQPMGGPPSRPGPSSQFSPRQAAMPQQNPQPQVNTSLKLVCLH